MTKSRKTYHNGLKFLKIQRQTVLSGPDLQSIKVQTNTFIEAAWIITQIELHIVGVHMINIEKSKGLCTEPCTTLLVTAISSEKIPHTMISER
jgi:hypothetical protein